MSKINETNYPRRTQANYADTDMLVLQAAGGNTYTTRIEDMRDDYEATLAPTIDKINDALAPAENGATASQAYAAGEHFMRDGAYCTAIGSGISSGGSFTLNTNYKTGTVADDVESLNSDIAAIKIEEIYADSLSFTNGVADITLPTGLFTKYVPCMTFVNYRTPSYIYSDPDGTKVVMPEATSFTGSMFTRVYGIRVSN